jgi:hypothetical protein
MGHKVRSLVRYLPPESLPLESLAGNLKLLFRNTHKQHQYMKARHQIQGLQKVLEGVEDLCLAYGLDWWLWNLGFEIIVALEQKY